MKKNILIALIATSFLSSAFAERVDLISVINIKTKITTNDKIKVCASNRGTSGHNCDDITVVGIGQSQSAIDNHIPDTTNYLEPGFEADVGGTGGAGGAGDIGSGITLEGSCSKMSTQGTHYGNEQQEVFYKISNPKDGKLHKFSADLVNTYKWGTGRDVGEFKGYTLNNCTYDDQPLK